MEINKRNIILTGYMGSGKSTVGKELSALTGLSLKDSDAEIEKTEGMSINDIFKIKGEEYFRELETSYLEKLLANGFNGILSCGGGMPVKEENRALLNRLGLVIYLKADADTVMKRLKSDNSRPLLSKENEQEKYEKIKEMLIIREPYYTSGAELVIDTSDRHPYDIAKEIENFLLK